ncbi:hypothetical protein [Streptomyces sp. NPDC096193]|uniref:hypothetical protein n=1 Tax=Streptomyces sp. NPDC096193 TaxID=3155821 RepID=UPI0033307904
MGDGTTRPIEQIKVGDQALAADPQTGESGPRRVDATSYTPDDRDFTSITVTEADSDGVTAGWPSRWGCGCLLSGRI